MLLRYNVITSIENGYYIKEGYNMAVREVERKVTKIGNSLGVTLPAEVLEHMNATQGDKVTFILEDNGKVSFKKHEKLDLSGLDGLDQDFIDGLQSLFDNYDNTLKNLADK